MGAIRTLNKLKKEGVWVRQRLCIPAVESDQIAPTLTAAPVAGPRRHQVARGDKLIATQLVITYPLGHQARR